MSVLERHSRPTEAATLADVLDRVLDKGLVIAGDIAVQIVDVEVLTIKVRLLLASADKAQEMGIDWWKNDAFLSGKARQFEHEHERLRRRIEQLEARLDGALPPQPEPAPPQA